MTGRLQALLWGVVGASLVFAMGAYGAQVSGGERGSFAMNFPAQGKAVGGPSPREMTGMIGVSLESAGLIKRTVQPDVLEISSHVVKNVGQTPRTIRFEGRGFPPGTEWHSRDRAWDPRTRTINRAIAPGEAVDVGLLMHVPPSASGGGPLVDGAIVVVDAYTGARLSELPVRVVASGVAVGGDCCER